MSLPCREDERRLFEHFVVAGLDYNSSEQLSPSLQECGCRNVQPQAPITDIIIIFPSLGETMPEGFEMVETTPLGYPADLNHGSLRMPSVFIGFRRGFHKPPLIDIGILDEGRGERPMVDTNVVKTTPFGRQANVNNASQAIYLTYRRAPPNSAPSQFVVTDICVIMANKGEIPPHTYYKIPKNLNKGMVGWDVYLCYKKSQGTSKRLAYKPAVLDYFPHPQNSEEDFRLAQNIPLFCLPMGALIECWPVGCQPVDKSFTTFVLTDEDGTKFYGAAVAFYEKYPHRLTEEQLERLDLTQKEIEGGAVEDSSSNNDPADQIEFHTNLAICLISRYPFFHSFKRFLYFIHRISQGVGISSVPIERYLSHLRYEVSFPTPKRPRVVMTIGSETISFESHDESQLPLNGAQHYETLKSLGPDNLMYLMLLALLEQKILVHSLRPWMLTAVAESVCSLMFPFHWQCPYVPQCPLGLAGVLHAPLPFIAGVDSRYFELYEDPPEDVTCFDLDTSTISASTVRHSVKLSIFPKRAIKQLRSSLENLYRDINKQNIEVVTSQRTNEFVPVDKDFLWQKQKRELEIGIQEAFLKFMCQIMAGYQSFLRPIKSAPLCAKATDTGNLFDLSGFLRSRDKSGTEFFKRFSETQSFMRFIEERSFISDKNAFNAFFDDCMNKIILADSPADITLLETDSSAEKNPSVFIAPPEPIVDLETGKEREFSYFGFPRKLNADYFQLDQLQANANESHKVPIERDYSRCAGVRTKPEIRSSHLAAVNAVRTNPMHWPKTLLFYSYSLWFMQLPSLLAIAPNKRKILLLAFNVMHRLEQSGVPLYDQVCYRIVIQLCGECGMPELAVRVLQAMQRAGLEQNAVTYGIYHRAVMDAEWPSATRQRASKLWSKLRTVVVGASRFKYGFNFERSPSSQDCNDATSADAVSIQEFATHTITVSPLNDTNDAKNRENVKPTEEETSDPLGALASGNKKQEDESRVMMSPSRAKFLAEHSSTPFASELGGNNDQKGGKPSSWFKGIANSPLMKMIRNQTFDSPRSLETNSEGSGMTGSPSLQSIATHVEGVSSKLRLGMSSLVQEVKSLNRSYGPLGSGTLFDSDSSDAPTTVDMADPAYQLDSGNTGTLLSESWWISEVHLQLRREQDRERLSAGAEVENTQEGLVEITLSTCTPCPNCRRMIYDEEIMAGWKVNDQNLNTICPHCVLAEEGPDKNKPFEFAPRLSIRYRKKEKPMSSWYPPGGTGGSSSTCDSPQNISTAGDINLPEDFSVAFVSPLVLRRELESWLLTDMKSLKDTCIKDSHPVIFWNLIYYLRRLGLPTHLYSWISPRYHIRCVFDRPDQHLIATPLYFNNPNNENLVEGVSLSRSTEVWNTVTQAVQENKLFGAMQALINDSRKIVSNGQICIGPHFPIFRDILFASLDMFGRALVRDNLDGQYPTDWLRLPVRIRTLLPRHDLPQPPVQRACRKIFLPLDLV